MSDSPGIHIYTAKGFLNIMQEKIIICTITVKMSTKDRHHQLGIHVVSLIKLLMTANIFETGFPGIFQECRNIPGQ